MVSHRSSEFGSAIANIVQESAANVGNPHDTGWTAVDPKETFGGIGRRNARLALERPTLAIVPVRRTTDYEETIVSVTSTSGFTQPVVSKTLTKDNRLQPKPPFLAAWHGAYLWG